MDQGWPSDFISGCQVNLVGWIDIDVLSGEQEQSFRLKTMELFRQYKIRILVSTDLVRAVIQPKSSLDRHRPLAALILSMSILWSTWTFRPMTQRSCTAWDAAAALVRTYIHLHTRHKDSPTKGTLGLAITLLMESEVHAWQGLLRRCGTSSVSLHGLLLSQQQRADRVQTS